MPEKVEKDENFLGWGADDVAWRLVLCTRVLYSVDCIALCYLAQMYVEPEWLDVTP